MQKIRKPSQKTFKKLLAEEIESLSDKDIGKYLALLKVHQQGGRLVDRRLAEAVIERYTGELCKRLSDTTRQIINVAGVGKTRDEKIDLERSITNLIDSTLRAFRQNMVMPKIDCTNINSDKLIADKVDAAVREIRHTRARGTRTS